MQKHKLFNLIPTVALVALTMSSVVTAQTTTTPPTTTTTTTTTGQPDINQLLQQFGPLLGLGGTTTGITPTTTPTDGTTTTDDTTPPTDGDGTGPQPTIVTNQFTTTSGGALGARRPGLMIQRAIAVQSGSVELPGNYTSEPGWVGQTIEDIGLTVIDTFSGLIDAFGALLGIGDIFDPDNGGTGGGNTLPNAATTGGGTTTPIQ